jgi:hypothetical protein
MASYTGGPWSTTSNNSTAGAPSASKAAATGVQHVADRVFWGFATGDTESAALQVNLRDGATGAGTVLCSWDVSAGTNTIAGPVLLSGVNSQNYDSALDAKKNLPCTAGSSLGFTGTAGVAMTLEFSANIPANAVACCTLVGHSLA